MCTAATYQTNYFYFGRTLDYEFSYVDEVTITPRNYPFNFSMAGNINRHYAIMGIAYVVDDAFCGANKDTRMAIRFIMRVSMKKGSAWQHSTLQAMPYINRHYIICIIYHNMNLSRGFLHSAAQ